MIEPYPSDTTLYSFHFQRMFRDVPPCFPYPEVMAGEYSCAFYLRPSLSELRYGGTPSYRRCRGARTAVGNMNAPERHLKRISLLEEEAAQPCRGIQYLSKCSLPTYRENIHVLHMVQERAVNKIWHVADPFLFPRSCPRAFPHRGSRNVSETFAFQWNSHSTI